MAKSAGGMDTFLHHTRIHCEYCLLWLPPRFPMRTFAILFQGRIRHFQDTGELAPHPPQIHTHTQTYKSLPPLSASISQALTIRGVTVSFKAPN